MNKIEHIGIAVRNLNDAIACYKRMLNVPHYKTEVVESEQVITAFFQCGESKIELLSSLSAESAIQKFIDKRGEGIHHIAYAVNDIYAEIERMKKEGFQAISQEPKAGADNKIVYFFHPKSTHGVLIELCQDAGI